MNTKRLIAVKTGKRFNLFSEDLVRDIQLSKTCTQVRLDKQVYDLYHGKTIEDSRRIIRLLEIHGGIPIEPYRHRTGH